VHGGRSRRLAAACFACTGRADDEHEPVVPRDSARSVTLAAGAELARRLGMSQTTVAREISRLENSGLIRTERVGTGKLAVPADDLPFVPALRQLLAYVGGIVPALLAEYESNDAVDEVFIFGSWADRVNGVEGPPPNDMDVAIVSDSLTRFDVAEERLCLEAATLAKIDQFVFESGHERLDELRQGSVPVLRHEARHQGLCDLITF